MKESASRIIDMHLHKSGTLEDPAGIIEHLNQNNVDVGFLIPNPLFLLHVLDQLRALYALRPAGKVLH